MPIYIPIQNQSFIKVVSSGAIAPEVNMPCLFTCLDNQGNTIKKTIVEIDASAGEVFTMLPSIESLANDLDCEISCIILDNSNIVNFISFDDGVTPPVDLIGQSTNLSIVAGTYHAGVVITFKPAYDGYWTYSVTEN